MFITKEFKFDMAHRLDGHKALCSNIHGHTYSLHITFETTQLDKIGVGIDFSELKKIVNEKVIKMLDHSCWLQDCDFNHNLIKVLKKMKQRLIITKHNPTAEYMCKYIKYLLRDIKDIVKIKLYETPTSYVEFSCERIYFNAQQQFSNLKETQIVFYDQNGKVNAY